MGKSYLLFSARAYSPVAGPTRDRSPAPPAPTSISRRRRRARDDSPFSSPECIDFRPSIPFRRQARDCELRRRGERLQEERTRVNDLWNEVEEEQRQLEEERLENESLREEIEEEERIKNSYFYISDSSDED